MNFKELADAQEDSNRLHENIQTTNQMNIINNDFSTDDIRRADEVFTDQLEDSPNYYSRYEQINNVNNDPYIEETNLAIQVSREEYMNNIEELIKQESIRSEDERIRKVESSNRIESFNFLIKKIDRLVYTEDDRLVKNFIKTTLNEYFQLNIDCVNMGDEMYNKLYKIIDTYYLLPSKKNSKTSITSDEDMLIRNIFLK